MKHNLSIYLSVYLSVFWQLQASINTHLEYLSNLNLYILQFCESEQIVWRKEGPKRHAFDPRFHCIGLCTDKQVYFSLWTEVPISRMFAITFTRICQSWSKCSSTLTKAFNSLQRDHWWPAIPFERLFVSFQSSPLFNRPRQKEIVGLNTLTIYSDHVSDTLQAAGAEILIKFISHFSFFMFCFRERKKRVKCERGGSWHVYWRNTINLIVVVEFLLNKSFLSSTDEISRVTTANGDFV